MKYFLVILELFLPLLLCKAQNPNMVYSSNKQPITIDLPSNREIRGGTVINVVYSGSGFSTVSKGAFEYACKLSEEIIPTTCPLKIRVEFSGKLPTGALAIVQPYSAIQGMCRLEETIDKVYAKRYVQIWGDSFFSDDSIGLSFYRDTEDVLIKFSSKVDFSYSLNPNDLKPSQYDFVTVSLQAIIKALGFTCKAYPENNKLFISTPANKYTYSILGNNADENFQFATSNNAYIPSCNDSEAWLLESSSPYKQGVSLNYFAESDSKESAIMQYGISKGSCIRYLGSSLSDFFSFCGWDRPLATNIAQSANIVSASTKNVINYQGKIDDGIAIQKNNMKSSTTLQNHLSSYLDSIGEVNKEGNFVMLKNGTWKEYSDLSELTDNDNYARTVDGYLRLKTVNKEWGPGYKYFNWKVRYNLYSYIPQKPMASLLSWRPTKNGKSANNGIRYIPEPIGNIMDVEIGLKNLEGTDYVVVEQTDSDYPVPFTYIIDNPLCGHFLTNMNRLYTSKFKITYVNANGQTTGDAFTLDLAGTDTLVPFDPESINIYDKVIEFSSPATTNYQNLKYVISDINKGCVVKKGDVDLLNDNTIDISTLPKSLYSISLYNDNNEKVGNLKWIKH